MFHEVRECLCFGLQVNLKEQKHEVLLVRGPDDNRWRLVDVGFGGTSPTHPILLEHPSSDAYTGTTSTSCERAIEGISQLQHVLAARQPCELLQ